MRQLGWAMLAMTLATGAAVANEADCRLDNTPSPRRGNATLARLTDATPRTYFVRDGSDAKGCPDTTPACRDRAFLVPGDRVVLGATRGSFVCASYVDAKGNERPGWLPASALARENPAPVALADWFGTWKRVEASITIKAGRERGLLAFEGEATWGASDTSRVEGGVHSGGFEGNRAPDGANLSFTVGESGLLPIGEGDEINCRIWMRRLGPYLLVDDNRNCGGANVSFEGVYVRRQTATRR